MLVYQWVLAATGDLPDWAQWGVLGLVILGFVTRQLVPGWLYTDIKEEAKVLRAENKELVELVLATQQTTLPALQEATKAVNDAMTAVNDAMAELRVTRRESGA